MGFWRILGVAAAVSAALAVPASADVGVYSVTPGTARPGDRVIAKVGGFYGQFSAPLYVVPLNRMPRYVQCGASRTCAPSSARAPTRWPYTRVGTATTANKGMIRFRAPQVPSGRYGFVVYCEPCYRGPGGSLIPSSRSIRVVR